MMIAVVRAVETTTRRMRTDRDAAVCDATTMAMRKKTSRNVAVRVATTTRMTTMPPVGLTVAKPRHARRESQHFRPLKSK